MDYAFDYEFFMLYPRIFIYTIIATAIAVYITFVAFRRPLGPQPATYGHFQTLVDLIDDWSVDEKGLFWWGDKGVGFDGIRHVGTSSSRQDIGKIQMDAVYA
ncbi:uncharacterized protein LY89DRAFT_737754 [Mollisia scopiformis]|uniref:Uncharacterized protein n=1 Tax=Mollisia scopiformis TaxID=149040 RepID=A0A194WYT1_MOLSC|nr:uncharacterized protein LY89DRAFT_737754 [Mollisia scopiformis]KUJ12849.1 hypothetical protein LY89DRAFT_737754 [Mollisia scopiformis]